MKTILYIITLGLIIASCSNSANPTENSQQVINSGSKTEIKSGDNNTRAEYSIPARDRFTLTDAEKILGEPARLTDSSTTKDGDALVYKSSYTAISKDQKAGKTRVIYFLFEQYTYDSAANRVYTSIKKSNENHGIKTLEDLGDEAYFHTDNTNFYFVMVRKGSRMIRMKVNKITGNTSLEDFNRVAKEITKAM